MLLRDLLQAQQRGVSDGGYGGADPAVLDVTLVTVDLDRGAAVAQSGTDADHVSGAA